MHLIGDSPALRALHAEITDAASSDAKVLITGESGVGKEIVAHMIHAGSARSASSLVTLNCAGVPDSLLESEVFGHVRGSFTGAYRDRAGHLEMAHRGTIFLDEIGEMSLRMQALLLRFLESGEIQRVGGEHGSSRLDVRVIAATNRNLPEQTALGAFRLDLYYRLNVIHLHIPPLRERREDIPLLIQHFLNVYCERYGVAVPPLDDAVMRRFLEYHWPGNVRELKNVAERLALRWRSGSVAFADLPPELLGRLASSRATRETASGSNYRRDLILERMVRGRETFWDAAYVPFISRDLTREDLRQIVGAGLEMTHGSYKQLAKVFNMPPGDYKRFLNFLRKHGCQLPFQSYRGVLVDTTPQAPSEAIEF
jgi:transcriptional regulator with PAS, ATPase and Fis domain